MTVLVVEDRGHHARLMAEALRAAGYATNVVQTGEEALQRLLNGPVDCLVVDYSLPLQSGIDTIRKARARQVQCPAILVASCLLPEVGREARRAGAFGCIEKHLNFLPALVRMVGDALGGHSLHAAVTSPAGRPRVVGRDAQLRALSAVLAQACEGRGRLVFVVGEEGIGKTALTRQVVEDARARGMRTLVGRCDAERAAYAPWFAVHRAYVAATQEATTIDNLVTQLAAAPDTWNVPIGQAQAVKTIRFERVAQFLCEIAAAQPLLVILDDLHFMDTASLEFLEHVGERLSGAPFVVLGAYRPAERNPVTDVVSRLGRLGVEHDALMLHLPTLSPADVSLYVTERTDGRADGDFALALYEKTDGHPLSVAEVLQLAIAENPTATTLTPEMLKHLPTSRLSTVDRRLHLLSEGTLEHLAVAAFLGRQFDPRIVLDVAGEDESDAAAALAEARRHGVLVEEESGECRFNSELCRDALVKRMSRSDGAVLHAAIVQAYERRHARNLDPWLPVIARHAVEAGWSGAAGPAIDYACRAASRLGRLLAWVEAAALYEDAVRLDDRWTVLSRAERASLENRLSEALWQAGNFPAARRAGERALALLDPAVDSEEFASAVLNFAGLLPGYGAIHKDPAVAPALEDALRRTSDGTCRRRPVLQARLAEELCFSDEGRGRQLMMAAMDAAGRQGDVAIEAATLRQGQWSIWPLPPAEREPLMRRMDELGMLAGDPALRLEAALMRVLGMFELGNVMGARQLLATCAKEANRLRLPYGLWLVKVTEAHLAISTARFDDAIQLAADAVALGQACGNPNATLFMQVQAGHVLWLRGEFDLVLKWLDGIATEVPALGTSVLMSQGVTLCEAGRVDEARSILDGLGPDPIARLPCDVTRPMMLAYLGEIAVRTGMKSIAAGVANALRPLSAYHVMMPPLFTFGPVVHHLGTIAAMLGKSSYARECFRQSIEMSRGSSAPHWVARTQLELAANLVALGERGEAKRLLEEAGAIASEHRLIPLARRIAEVRESCQTPTAADRRTHRCVFRPMPPKQFEVIFDGEETRPFPLILGLRYIWELIRRKDRSVDVVHLYEAFKGPSAVVEGGSETRTIDAAARRDYQRRLRELAAEREDALRTGDQQALARMAREREWLDKELDSAESKLGCAPRRKIQQTVRQAIKHALNELKARAHLGELAGFLDLHVKTGFECEFISHPDWVFDL